MMGFHLLKGKWINIMCAVTIALGGLVYGIDTGIVSTTIAHASFNMYMFGSTVASQHAALTGAIVSVYYAGGAIGSFGVGWLMDYIGRKQALLTCTVFTIIGTGIQTGSINIGMFLAGRVIAGIATGGLLTLVPVYIAELAPPETRARLVGMKGLLVALGYMMANWVGYAGDFATGDAQWRIPLGIQIPPSIFLMVMTIWLPASPRWLVSKDRHEEAEAVLQQLHGHRGADFASCELAQIQEQIALERLERRHSAIAEIFTFKYARRTLLANLILNMTKLSGSGVVNNYQSLFYSGLGYKGRTVLLLTGIYGFMGVIGQTINLLFVSDKWSRRMTVCLGSFVLAMFLILLTIMSALYGSGSNASGSAAGIAFIFLFSLSYSVFFNSTVWVLVSEIFPQHVRAVGNSFAVFTTSVTNIWLSQVTPLAFQSIDWKLYFVFIVLNVAAGLIYFFFLPETNQKTLEEIAEAFAAAKWTTLDTRKRISFEKESTAHIEALEK